MILKQTPVAPAQPSRAFFTRPPTDCFAIVSSGRAFPKQGRGGGSGTEAYGMRYVEVDERPRTKLGVCFSIMQVKKNALRS